MSQPPSLLILARSTPYGGQQARAALDVILTAAAFEMAVSVVFLDEGVRQLALTQDTDAGEQKNIGNMIPALALYDVDQVYVHAPSAVRYGMPEDNRLPGIEDIDDDALRLMTGKADQVLVF